LRLLIRGVQKTGETAQEGADSPCVDGRICRWQGCRACRTGRFCRRLRRTMEGT
jgi:hypothetical protein